MLGKVSWWGGKIIYHIQGTIYQYYLFGDDPRVSFFIFIISSKTVALEKMTNCFASDFKDGADSLNQSDSEAARDFFFAFHLNRFHSLNSVVWGWPALKRGEWRGRSENTPGNLVVVRLQAASLRASGRGRQRGSNPNHSEMKWCCRWDKGKDWVCVCVLVGRC